MSVQFPTAIFTPRATENLPGIVYDPDQKQNMFSEDFQNLGAEITAVETYLLAKKPREVLQANRTYYVRTNGNDSNNGLTNDAGGAFLTIQKAIDTVAGLDISIYDVTIQVADGTYTGANTLKSIVGSGTVIIVGNTATPSNVLINTTTGCFNASAVVGKYQIAGFKLASSASYGFYIAGAPCNVIFGYIDFGACYLTHIYIEGFGAKIRAYANYSISGGCAWAHVTCIAGAYVQLSERTVTISNTPAFAQFVWLERGLGMIEAYSMTFSGSATGKRYDIKNNAVLFVNGASATYLPGNASGTAVNGALYV